MNSVFLWQQWKVTRIPSGRPSRTTVVRKLQVGKPCLVSYPQRVHLRAAFCDQIQVCPYSPSNPSYKNTRSSSSPRLESTLTIFPPLYRTSVRFSSKALLLRLVRPSDETLILSCVKDTRSVCSGQLPWQRETSANCAFFETNSLTVVTTHYFYKGRHSSSKFIHQIYAMQARTIARKFPSRGICISAGGPCHSKIDKNSTDLQCFMFYFGGLGAFFGGLSPPTPPRGDGTDANTFWATVVALTSKTDLRQSRGHTAEADVVLVRTRVALLRSWKNKKLALAVRRRLLPQNRWYTGQKRKAQRWMGTFRDNDRRAVNVDEKPWRAQSMPVSHYTA